MPEHLDHSWNVARLLDETFVQSVEVHPRIGSTNDRALQLAGQSVDVPCLILAEEQTSGRGRGSNRWWSAGGAVTCSLLLRPDHAQLPLARWPQISLTAGSAMCEAIRRRLPGTDVRLKWPNDVYLLKDETSRAEEEIPDPHTHPSSFILHPSVSGPYRKVCGVLVEIPPRHPDHLVIGVGLNVNNASSAAPPELRRMLVSLSEVAGADLDREELLCGFLGQLEEQLRALAERPESVVERWRHDDLLGGRCVTIDSGGCAVTGTCAGIDDDGALLLRTEAGLSRFYGGVVTCW